MADGSNSQGFGLVSVKDLNEGLQTRTDAAGDWLKDQQAKASDWLKDQQAKASDWFKKREAEILAARDRVLKDAKGKIADARQKYEDARKQIQSAFKAPLSVVQQQIDRVLGERDKAIQKLKKEKDTALAKWDTWESEQRKKLESTHNKAISEARDQVFEDGGTHLQSMLSKVTSLQMDVKNEKSSMMARNPFGVVSDIEKAGLQQIQSLGQHAVTQLATKIADLSSTIQQSTQQYLSSLAKYSMDRWKAVTEYSEDRWVTFRKAAATEYHNALEGLDTFWEDLNINGGPQVDIYHIMLYSTNTPNQYRVIFNRGLGGADVRGYELTVKFRGEIVSSDYFTDSGALYFTLSPHAEKGLYEIQLRLKDRRNHYFESATGVVELPTVAPHGVTIFHDEGLDPSAKTDGTAGRDSTDGNGGTGTGTTTESTENWVISDAEENRGFALPYLVASAGVEVDDAGKFRVRSDDVEVTDQTIKEFTFTKTNAAGEEVSKDGETRSAFEKRVEGNIVYYTDLAETWTAFLREFEPAFQKYKEWHDDAWSREIEKGEELPLTMREWIVGESTGARAYWDFIEFIVKRNEQGDIQDPWLKSTFRYKKYNDDPVYIEHLGGWEVMVDEAIGAQARVEELRKQVWSPDSLPTFTLKTSEEIAKGLVIPGEVTSGGTWSLTMSTKEVAGGRPEITKFSDRLNKDFFSQVFSSKDTIRKWKEFRTNWASEQRARDAAATADLIRDRAALRDVQNTFKQVASESEDLFGAALPGFGFIVEGGKTYMYAKEGQVGAAAMSGAFVLLDVLFSGLGGKAMAEIGKLVSSPFPKSVSKVIEVSKDLAQRGSRVILDALGLGAKSMKATVANLKAAGMNGWHAKGIQQLAASREKMYVVRSTNVASAQYHGRKGYRPKSADIFFKTHPSEGLVKVSRREDGLLVDMSGRKLFYDKKGNVMSFVIEKQPIDVNGRDLQRILRTGPDGNGVHTATEYFMDADGYVVNRNGEKFFGDYDLMGVYEPVDQVSNSRFRATTFDEKDLNELNRATDSRMDMFQHGANDDFLGNYGGEVTLGNSAVGDTFIVFDADGTMEICNLERLKRIYEDLGIPWSLNENQLPKL